MTPDYIASRVLHRDASLLVLDKPAGLAVHAGPHRGRGPRAETLTDGLDHLRFGLPRRPEAAHRLDRETSGCLVLGRHRQALARLSELFRAGLVSKTYWALVEGGPSEPEGRIELPVARRSPDPADWRMRPDPAGQPALTQWRVLGRDGARGLTWLELTPQTGRTHQLRVHCAASGWPILGDAVYGAPPDPGRPPLMLHARRIVVPMHPRKPAITVEADAPDHLATRLLAFA